jgi:hypothetical protein
MVIRLLKRPITSPVFPGNMFLPVKIIIPIAMGFLSVHSVFWAVAWGFTSIG